MGQIGPQMGQIRAFSYQITIYFWQIKYTETDPKIFRICPIWCQSGLILGPTWHPWSRSMNRHDVCVIREREMPLYIQIYSNNSDSIARLDEARIARVFNGFVLIAICFDTDTDRQSRIDVTFIFYRYSFRMQLLLEIKKIDIYSSG